MRADHPHRVLIVYPFMPHYRYGIFKALDESTRIECTFASDPKGVSGVEPMVASSVQRHHSLTNRRLPRGKWQSGLLKHVVTGRYEAFIFLGDASSLSTWVAAVILRLRRKRVLFWTIGWHAPEKGLTKVIRLAFYRLAHEVLLYGNVAKALGIQLGFPESRMRVIHNSQSTRAPLSRADLEPMDRNILKSEYPIVGAVIRLNPIKRLELLILAASELRRRGNPITVFLAGEGPAGADLLKLAAEEDVDLRLAGPVYAESDITAIYDAMAVTVVPSAVGLTAIQSMAHGVPVISDDSPYTQMPEWEAIIPGVTGDYFDPGNHVALADVIARWIARQAQDEQTVHKACIAEVTQRWHPDAQLPLIEAAVLGENTQRRLQETWSM